MVWAKRNVSSLFGSSSDSLWRAYALVGGSLSLVALISTWLDSRVPAPAIPSGISWTLHAGMAASLLVAVGMWLWRPKWSGASALSGIRAWPRWSMGAGIVLAASIASAWYAQSEIGIQSTGSLRIIWFMWWIAPVQALGLYCLGMRSRKASLLGGLIAGGLVAEILIFASQVSAYPFSLGWSEGSRFYYGSLPVASQVYGYSLPWSSMHGSRYLLLSLAFLFPKLTIFQARLWQVMLWICLTALASFGLVRRLRTVGVGQLILWGSWLFLFFLQGAVYYHLQIAVAIILFGVRRDRTVRALLAVVAASVWAGMSRANWFIVPSLLAVAIYVLETPLDAYRGIMRYFRTPLVWILAGLCAAGLGQWGYVAVSNQSDLSLFTTTLHSPLLWHRLLPNSVFAPGVLLGTLGISLPSLALIFIAVAKVEGKIHALRLLYLAVLLVAVGMIGLVVSVKIGGGGDLHNMDAYLVMLALISGYLLAGTAISEGGDHIGKKVPHALLLLLLVAIPAWISIGRIPFPEPTEDSAATAELGRLGEVVSSYGSHGPVLFISQRHLQAFGSVPSVPVVPDYELVTLMEMAISDNKPYLQHFYQDLANKRFAAIVAQRTVIGGTEQGWRQETEAWNDRVARPFLCAYERVDVFSVSRIAVYIPRQQVCLHMNGWLAPTK